jgi:hypothetical protein
MKSKILKIGLLFLIFVIVFGCSNSTKTDKDGNITIKATFISAESFEGEADLVFETKDGKKITFYKNYFNSQEPELDFMFIGEDGFSANSELVGKVFVLKYKVLPEGRISIQTGNAIECNQIIEAKLK